MEPAKELWPDEGYLTSKIDWEKRLRSQRMDFYLMLNEKRDKLANLYTLMDKKDEELSKLYAIIDKMEDKINDLRLENERLIMESINTTKV